MPGRIPIAYRQFKRMPKAGLILLPALLGTNAFAEWTPVGRSEPSTLYADIASIQKTGDIARMLDLLDFKNLQDSDGHQYRSSKTLSEYDCKERRARIISFSWHSSRMGAGQIVHVESDSSEWTSIPPKSGVEKLWTVACGKEQWNTTPAKN